MFTQDQASLMQTYLNSVQSDFVTGVCTPGAPDFNLTATNTPILTCPTTDTEAVFALTYTTISGFSENTTFSQDIKHIWIPFGPFGPIWSYLSHLVPFGSHFRWEIGWEFVTKRNEPEKEPCKSQHTSTRWRRRQCNIRVHVLNRSW